MNVTRWIVGPAAAAALAAMVCACGAAAAERGKGVDEPRDPAGGAGTATAAAGTAAPAASGEPGVLSRAAVDRVRRDGAARFMGCVDLTDVREGSRFLGWRVRPNACGTAYFAMGGLRPDDVVRSVNALPLGTPDEFMFAWEAVTTAAEIRVDLVRGSVPMTLVFHVR